jgi:hypothetical protein
MGFALNNENENVDIIAINKGFCTLIVYFVFN